VNAPRYRVDPGLLEYATEHQKKYVEAINRHRGMSAAARALGQSVSTVRDAIYALEKKAAMCGYSPSHGMTHAAPSPYIVKGVSTLYVDGEQKAQWVKTSLDDSKVQEVLQEFVKNLVSDAKGLSKIISPPKHSSADLLNVFPLGDPHFGMYAWAAEAGDDFDTEIAEKITFAAVDRLVASAPSADTAIILPLGDLLHADDTRNKTPQSGFTLDVDTRYQKVVQIALRALKRSIYRALEKHKKVIAKILPGNHDPHSSFAIALSLAEYFSNNPRVTVDLSPSLFWFYRFHNVLIGATHGDKAKGNDLLGVMATDRSEDWGQTKFRYWYTGHIHNFTGKELPGVVLESFRTLAPKDAWHAGMGYRAGRDAYCITHHKDFGEIERHRCDVAMVKQ
jgi:hypothetical protein